MIERLRTLSNDMGLQAVGAAPAIDEVRELFPWAKSVVVAAVCYLPPASTPEQDAPTGRVARFAQSADYHDVLRAKLAYLAEAITAECPDARLEICVDTAPIPERKLAVLAGIATRGKNGNVFVDGCGSYAALGEVITDAALPTPSSVDTTLDACGTCEACINSCPAQAITAPGKVDRSRCVSALTQSSGIIPLNQRHAMGDRIYGCDTCQEVCPRNTSVSPTCPEFAEPRFPGPTPELIPLIRMTSADFNTQVRNSPIGWIRRTRIRRNAAIAAGNLKSVECEPTLIEMLRDENPVLRTHAAWALGEIATESAMQALEQAVESEQDPMVSEEIKAALANK